MTATTAAPRSTTRTDALVDLTGARAVQFVFAVKGGGRKQVVFDLVASPWSGARYERLEMQAIKAMIAAGHEVAGWEHYLIK